MVIMLVIIIVPLFSDSSRRYIQIPLPGVEGVWADSVFHTMTSRQKISQLLIYKSGLSLFHDTVIPPGYTPAGGFVLPSDSLKNYKGYKRWSKRQDIPSYGITKGIDSIMDFPVLLSVEGVLSIRHDSIIKSYLENHILTAKQTGATIVVYPLWVDRKHTRNLPDTILLKRQVEYTRYFIEYSMQQGLIPVMPLPEIALRITAPANKLDSVVFQLCASLINPDLPAILLDSVPESLEKNEGLRYHLKQNFEYQGLILLERDVLSAGDFRYALDCGVDIIITEPCSDGVIAAIAENISGKGDPEHLVNFSVLRSLYYKEWLLNQEGREPFSPPGRISRIRLSLLLEQQSIIKLIDSVGMIPFREAGLSNYIIHYPERSDYITFLEYFGYFADFRQKRYSSTGRLALEANATNIILLENISSEEARNLEEVFSRRGRLRHRAVVIHLGAVDSVRYLQKMPAVVNVGRNSETTQRILANFLFGGTCCEGIIPWDITRQLGAGSGMTSSPKVRLNYTIPEEAGIDALTLMAIDSIVNEAIMNAAFPGCQVFIAVAGNVVYNKAFGTTAYDPGEKVTLTHLYDIASVTKTAATTLAMMKMYEQGKIRLNDQLGRFFKDTRTHDPAALADTLVQHDTIVVKGSAERISRILSGYDSYNRISDTLYHVVDTLVFISTRERNVFRIPVKNLLTHRSGLPPALPISGFISTYDRRANVNRFREIYSPVFIKDSATIRVAEDMYIFNHYFDTLWMRSRSIGMSRDPEYVYSDANMIFVQMAIDSLNRRPISSYLRDEFYRPLGLRTCTFHPLESVARDRIVPTAMDLRWRRQLIHGYVHDPTAALFGGVAGNAGLFSNAADLGVLHQMLLQGGSYGGRQYLDPETIETFTSRQEGGHRGLGFDKKSGEKSIIAPSASFSSYGHTGFTGTCVWVDPEHQIVFVFLSNRIHPNTENQKINFFRVRQRVHQVVYDALSD